MRSPIWRGPSCPTTSRSGPSRRAGRRTVKTASSRWRPKFRRSSRPLLDIRGPRWSSPSAALSADGVNRKSALDSLECGRDFFAGSNGEADLVSSHGRFVWYELMTTDIETAKAFYANVVGWGTRDSSASGLPYSLFTSGDSPVAGLMNVPMGARRTGVTPQWMGYVAVDDVDAAVDRIKQLGGAVHVPPTDLPNISRFSVVADPQTATLALVKGRNSGRAPSAELEAPGRVGWHELLAADWEKAFAFYGELFGWQKADSHTGMMGTYQGFSTGGKTIGGMLTKPATLPFPYWLYYFNTDDVQAAAKRVEAGGGQILFGPTAVPGGAWIVHCTDPQGAIFALLDRRERKATGYFISSASRVPRTSGAAEGLGNRKLPVIRYLRSHHRHLAAVAQPGPRDRQSE